MDVPLQMVDDVALAVIAGGAVNVAVTGTRSPAQTDATCIL